MREFVFPDPSLTSRAGQFVWLAVNIEDERNGPFLVKFPSEGVPTFAVVDPKDESVALRLVGSMTVPQLHAFLDTGRIAVGGGGGGREAEAALRTADQHYGARRYAEAAAAYRLALDKAPADWPSYGRAVEALLFSYQQTSATQPCVALAASALERLAALVAQDREQRHLAILPVARPPRAEPDHAGRLIVRAKHRAHRAVQPKLGRQRRFFNRRRDIAEHQRLVALQQAHGHAARRRPHRAIEVGRVDTVEDHLLRDPALAVEQVDRADVGLE